MEKIKHTRQKVSVLRCAMLVQSRLVTNIITQLGCTFSILRLCDVCEYVHIYLNIYLCLCKVHGTWIFRLISFFFLHVRMREPVHKFMRSSRCDKYYMYIACIQLLVWIFVDVVIKRIFHEFEYEVGVVLTTRSVYTQVCNICVICMYIYIGI